MQNYVRMNVYHCIGDDDDSIITICKGILHNCISSADTMTGAATVDPLSKDTPIAGTLYIYKGHLPIGPVG